MKLVRIAAFAFVALSAACASSPAPVAAVSPGTPSSNAISTTRVNAAVWEEESTPRVGKPQRSDDASMTDESESLAAPKDEPRRSEGRRSWK